ncbi:unnamed protein product, partial [Adineta steineri]
MDYGKDVCCKEKNISILAKVLAVATLINGIIEVSLAISLIIEAESP